MSAKQSTQALSRAIFRRTGLELSFDDANTLRRAQLALHRWHERECGDGNAHGSWMIQRDDFGEGTPYLVHHHYANGRGRMNDAWATRTRIPDREASAIRRVADVCARNGLHYFVQTDPRGCSLYVAGEVLTDVNYSSAGVPCCND